LGSVRASSSGGKGESGSGSSQWMRNIKRSVRKLLDSDNVVNNGIRV